MSLRLRLTLVILAVVAVMGVVSLVSVRLNRGIVGLVADLDRTSSAALDAEPVVGRAFELEGRWDDQGVFVASDIERLPRSRRPKLRGSLQAYDPATRELTLYGRPIRLDEETDCDFELAGGEAEERLRAGSRVEVSCKVEPDGTWSARKLETDDVKDSDKVKGTVTAAEPDADGGHALEIDGLAIRVPPGVEVSYPSGPLYRMEIATQMTLAIEEALAASQELLNQRRRELELRARGNLEAAAEVDSAVEDAADRVEDSVGSFAHYLAESRAAAEDEIRSATVSGRRDQARVERERIERWLTPMEAARTKFEGRVARLLELIGPDPDGAEAFLQQVLEPSLRTEVAPTVRAYQVETEEELAAELASIAARASSAARLAILTNLAGIALAVAAGLLVARSISGPIRILAAAARRVGQGDLASRVEVRGGGELGELAAAFDRMTDELSATTVSVARLEGVIDSMAGALVLLDPAGRIASVNPAAADLLGYRRDELVGQPLEVICPDGKPAPAAAERLLRRKDGSTLPVSFSSAELRGGAREGAARVCLALDLSEHKRMEEQLRRSLADKELLLREVHHRVKNNLQVISSLLDLQSRSISDPQSLERFQESQDRIRSMVFIHDQLHRTDDLESIDLQAYLELLVAHLAQSHVDPPGRIRLRTELEPLRLDLDRALACGLIVNELVTNALKHAFAPGAGGEVVVGCRVDADGEVTLEVADDGRGFERPAADDPATTLGLSLVETLVRQLRGRLDVDGGAGARFAVRFPAGVMQGVA